jgi:hypothetical protein
MNSGSSASISPAGSRRSRGQGLVVVDVAAVLHRDVAAGAAHDDAGVTARALLEALSALAFSGTCRAAAQSLVGGDQRAALGTGCGPQRFRREAAEHDRVDGADARAGEHGVGGLGIIGI